MSKSKELFFVHLGTDERPASDDQVKKLRKKLKKQMPNGVFIVTSTPVTITSQIR